MPVWRRRADAGYARGIGKGKTRRAFFRDQPERRLQQRLFQVAVMIAALGAAMFLAPAHVKGFYMSRTQRSLAGWLTLRFALHFGQSSGGFLDLGGKIRHFLHLADFDDFVVGSGAAPGPGDRLLPRLDVDHPVAAKHLLG